ncbi:MAG: DUF2029 domain-containing protein [Acidobacteriota bacterium]|nr:DUF2029 domain-containing protein [Acidobacteriota bacterium]
MLNLRAILSALLCLAGLAYFVVRGPYREVGSLNSYDFASVYGAARCWLNGQNPYDMKQVRDTLREAGNKPPLPYSDPPPSVYLPTTLPVIAPVAWLSWIPARLIWCLMSVSMFGCSLLLIFRNVDLPLEGKFLLGAAVLFFSPTTSGLSTGNLSVFSCSLVILAIYLALKKRWIGSGLLLGLAHCLKPQVSIFAVVLFALWTYWKPLFISFVVPAVSAAVSIMRAPSLDQYRQWLASLHEGIAATLAPGAINDPRPSNIFSYHMVNTQAVFGVFVHNLAIDDILVWAIAAAMVVVYLWLRRRVAGDRRWCDMAFFSAVTLTIVYHRYYDAQLLLASVPFVAGSRKRLGSIAIPVLCFLLLLEFPLQAILAQRFSPFLADKSIIGFLLFRHQPLAVLAMCLFLIPWFRRSYQRDEAAGSSASVHNFSSRL